MSKVKQIFKLSFLSFIAVCLTIGGWLFSIPKSSVVNADVVDSVIENQLPVFFNNNDYTKEYYYNNENAVVKFDFEEIDGIYKYYPEGKENENHYYYIDITQISLTLDGQPIVFANDASANDIILNSSTPALFDPNFFSKTLDFEVVLNTSNENNTITSSEDSEKKTVTINKQGLLNISAQYNLYDVTFTPAGSGSQNAKESYTLYNNITFDYSIFMLDKSTYFLGNDESVPNVEYNTTNTSRTPSESSNHRYNYFYNFKSSNATSNDLPYITYNPLYYKLTISKTINNSSSSETISFNPETKAYNEPSFVYDLTYDEETGLIKVYFNDLGLYNLHFDVIYTFTNGQNTNVYNLSKTVLDQKFYVYGAQMYYTDYDKNDFVEFKTIDSNQITASADITRKLSSLTSVDSDGTKNALSPDDSPLKEYLNLKENSPVRTNQTPVKLSTYGSNIQATLYTKTDDGWSKGEGISATKNISEDGIYVLVLTYNFANYTNASGALDTATKFYQYFYFQIQKETPQVDVKKENSEGGWETLYSKQYTNRQVKITYNGENESAFDSSVYVTLTRKDFVTGQTGSEIYLFPKSKNEGLINESGQMTVDNGNYTITYQEDGNSVIVEKEDGSYTIKIYYGKNAMGETPMTSTFTIDTTEIENLSAYSITTSSNKNAIANKLEGNVTNEAFTFNWKNTKQSGALTYGYFKYYSLNYFDYYDTTDLGSTSLGTLIYTLLANDLLATDAQLDLSKTSNEWMEYSNSSVYPSSSIPANCVKSSAGLYIFQVFDEAGNTSAYYMLLDDSSPYFVLQTSSGYSLISSNHTLISDATLYWSDYKGININLGSNTLSKTGSAYEISETFYTNKNGQVDDTLKAVFEQFIDNGGITSFSSSAFGSRAGTYYLSKINDTIAFKNYDTDYYSLLGSADQDINSYEIQFSYSVYYGNVSGNTQTSFLFSTTNTNVYLDENGQEVDAGTITNLKEADLYKIIYDDGSKEFFYGEQGSQTVKSLKDKTTLATVSSTVGTEEYSILLNGISYSATKETFVDMEGEYGFMIMDASNTKGANLSLLDKLTRYPSNSQYISVTGDTSLTKVTYIDNVKDEEGVETTLFTAAYSSTSSSTESSAYTIKNSFYTPTALEKVLTLSFIPTIKSGTKTTQVKSITLEFYPYETQIVANKTADGKIKLSYYRTLASEPSFVDTAYEFDGSTTNENVVTYEINLANNMTREGKYVITRIYETGDEFTVDKYDYTERNLTVYVDREGVVSGPSTISYTAKEYSLTQGEETLGTAVVYQNAIIVSPNVEGGFDGLDQSDIVVKNNEETQQVVDFEECYILDGMLYIIMPQDFEFGSLEIMGFTSTSTGENVVGPSYESIVGGDIFVNMYEGIDENSGILSVTFPHVENLINSGDSFYTQDRDSDWENNLPSIVFETNKLPVKVYVPEYKYTKYNSENIKDGTNYVTEYDSIINEDLSYYEKDVAYSSITNYKLFSEIKFVPSSGASSITYTSSTIDENGYMTFTNQGQTKNEFTEAGTYYVLIVQSNNSSGAGTENNFRKEYMFAFTIKSSAPSFDLTTNGKSLETLDEQKYYTNQKTFTATWEDSNSRYIADIDKTNLLLQFNSSIKDIIVDVSDSSNLTIKYANGDQADEVLNKIKQALSYNLSGNVNTLTFNFETAGLYTNGTNVGLTMQFVGHNEYYQKTTKSIVVDKTASNDEISSLISKLSSFSTGTINFTESSLRNYYNVEGQSVATASEASYNVSKNIETFKYYSYMVDKSFLTSLASKAQENKNKGANYDGTTINVYYRVVSDPYSDEYNETSYDNFVESSYSQLSTNADDYVYDRAYYEIIEQDLAGNLTIYLVYLYQDDQGEGFQSAIGTEYQGFEFTDGDKTKRASDAQILAQTTSGRVVELFSSTNFSLTNLNFRNDPWLKLTITRNNSTRYYMFSPWLDGAVYNMTTGQIEQVSSLFSGYASSTNEISLSISNRADGTSLKLALHLVDGVSLNAEYSNSNTEEYLRVGKTSIAYPVQIVITSGDNTVKYDFTNDPNSLENLLNANYNYNQSWISNDDINYTYDAINQILKFNYINLPVLGDKVRYKITDNFGNVTPLIHIFGQGSFEEISSSGNMYQDIISDPAITTGEYVTSYISPTDLKYSYNSNVYIPVVEKYLNGKWETASQDQDYSFSGSEIVTLTFPRNSTAPQINQRYRITVYEVDEANPTVVNENMFVKKLYLHLYEIKPELAIGDTANLLSTIKFSDNYGVNITEETLTDTSAQYVTINGSRYKVSVAGQTFALNITLSYEPEATLFDYPYEVLYYKQGSTMTDFETIKSGTRLDESGVYYFLVRYATNNDNPTLLNNEYDLYKIELLDSSSEFYRVTNNGVVVEKSSLYYTYEGREYSDYYIVNVKYDSDQELVKIVPNDYQNINVYKGTDPIDEGNDVITVGYLVTNYTKDFAGDYTIVPTETGISPFRRMVFITYIPATQRPVAEAVYYFNSSETFDMLGSNSINAIVEKTNYNIDSVTIKWSSTYGINTNLVNLEVLKDGVSYPISYRTEGGYNYTTLSVSGTYTLTFRDTAGNVQTFAYNTSSASTTQKFVFLKDVAFSMTYTDGATGETIVSDPINKGVFNGDVKLTILNISEYYTAQSSGSGQGMIRAKKNGVDITSFNYDANTQTFTFSDPGYYSVYFVATSTTGVEVRQQTYNFTIVNPNESRYSYEFSPYQNYYIKSVVKDNLGDITQTIIDDMNSENPTMGLKLQTTVINGQTYLKELLTSYIGTGSGRYTVTIATNGNYDRTDYTKPTELTFSYWINMANVPIEVSIEEGGSSSSDIIVSFNAERVYQAVGDCTLTIANLTYQINENNMASLGTVQVAISGTGTYFITARSMSGNLLYSYKVTKTEPLNGWAIAAIVIGCVAAIVAVIIIIRLRKKIKVK